MLELDAVGVVGRVVERRGDIKMRERKRCKSADDERGYAIALNIE